MKCPTRGDLMRHLDDVLEGEQKVQVSKHVAECDRCQSVLERLSDEDKAFMERFRESFDTPIGDADEERIVTSLLTLHRMRRSGRKREIPPGQEDDGPKSA